MRRSGRVLLAAAAVGFLGVLVLGSEAPSVSAASNRGVATGSGKGGEELRVVIASLRRPEQELARFVEGASTPGSATYGRFLTLGALRRTYGAKAGDRHRVLRFLRRAAGVRSVQMGTSGSEVMATMTAAASQRLFCARGRRPPRGNLCVPRQLRKAVGPIVAGGIYKAGKTGASRQASAAATGSPQGCKAALESGALTPNQISTAYEVDPLHGRGLEGRGIRVATLSSALVESGELKTWAGCFGLPTPNFHQAAMPGASQETSSAPEETYLDAEALAALAPRLQRITAITVPLLESFQGAFSLFMFGALDPARQGGRLPDLLSISDGVCETRVTAAARAIGEHMLRDAAALGITVVSASGDLGFQGCQEEAEGADWPTSSRYVTAVGGTEVSLSPSNVLTNQVVWSTFGTEPAGNGTGSGGGPSKFWPRPGWQLAPGIGPALQPGNPTRLTPDLASMASFTPGLATLGGGEGWGPGGGTSAATPLTAAILSLVAEQERAAGRPPLGSVDPLLYELARGPSYGTVFWDVVSGTSSPQPSTPLGRSPAGGAAQPGYDLATGLGTLRAAPFAAAVAASRQG